ncbi:hypothetical protein HCC60_07845 [Streptococcus suis]|nr:hypothetical protein [Streptococcus suis]
MTKVDIIVALSLSIMHFWGFVKILASKRTDTSYGGHTSTEFELKWWEVLLYSSMWIGSGILWLSYVKMFWG